MESFERAYKIFVISVPMRKGIPKQLEGAVWKEYKENQLPRREIAKKHGLKYGTVSKYITARNNGFDSVSGYNEHLAKQAGYDSYAEQVEDYPNRDRRQFGSWREYKQYLAKRGGSASAYDRELKSLNERGYGSKRERMREIEEENQEKPERRELADFIRESLKKVGKSERWLADQAEVDQSMISRYVNAKAYPRKAVRERMYIALLNTKSKRRKKDNLKG